MVTLHDSGTDGESHWLVLDLPAGGDLGGWLDRFGPMPARMATEACWCVAQAIEASHRAGFAHLDVRPASAFVDKNNVVRLGNFAFSEANGSFPVDIAALGMMLYALASGHLASDPRSMRLELVPVSLADTVRVLIGATGPQPDATGARAALDKLLRLCPPIPQGTPSLERPLELPNPPGAGLSGTPIPTQGRTPIQVATRTGVPLPNQASTPKQGPTPRPGAPRAADRPGAPVKDAFAFTVAVPMSDRYVEDDGVGGILPSLPGHTPAPAPAFVAPTPTPTPNPLAPEPETADVILKMAGALALLIVVLLVAVLFVGKSSVDRAQAAAEARRGEFVAALTEDVEIMPEIRALGGDAPRLEAAWRTFQDAGPEATLEAAVVYADTVRAVWSGTPRGPRAPATDQRVRRIDRALGDYQAASARWESASQQGLGLLVTGLGLAEGP